MTDFDALPKEAKLYAALMLGVRTADDAKELLVTIWRAAAAAPVRPTVTDAEVEAMCEMLDDYGDGISNSQLDAVAAFIRKQAAQIDKYRNGYQGSCYACEPVAMLNEKLAARIAELERAKLDAYMTEYHPGKIANND